MLNDNFQYKDHFFGLMLEDKADERLAVLLKDVSSISILLYRSYLLFHTE